MAMAKSTSLPALDGGWGWMIVFAASMGQFIFGMICRGNGVFFLEFMEVFGESATATSWVFALKMCLWSGLGPVTTMLCARFSCRSVAAVGAFFIFIGLLGTSVANSLGLTYISLGLVVGVGLSFNTVPAIVITGEYFEKRRGVAMAIATIGSGIGAFTFPPLLQMAFSYYGYLSAIMLVAAFSGHAMVSALLLRPLEEHYGRGKTKAIVVEVESSFCAEDKSPLALSTPALCERNGDQNDTNESDFSDDKYKLKSRSCNEIYIKGKNDTSPDIPATKKSRNICRGFPSFDWSLFKEKPFVFLFSLSVMCAFCFGTGVSFLPALAVHKGISHTNAAFLLSLFGVLDTICIIPVGLIFDLRPLRMHPKRRISLYLILTFVLSVSTAAVPLSSEYSWMVTWCLIRGIGSGVFLSQRLTILADMLGKERAPKALGFQIMSFAIGSILSRTLGGLFKDYCNTYEPNFYIGGISAFVIALAFLLYIHLCPGDISRLNSTAHTAGKTDEN